MGRPRKQRSEPTQETAEDSVEQSPEVASDSAPRFHVVSGRGVSTLRGIVTSGEIVWQDLSRDEVAGRLALDELRKGGHLS